MTSSKSSNVREGAFWKKRLPSFFIVCLFLIFSAGCKTPEVSSGGIDWKEKRGVRQLERIRKEKKLSFAVLKGSRNEKTAILLAEKAAELLGMKLAILLAAPESIPSLLRSNRADFAWGDFQSEGEVKSFYLLPLQIEKKDETLIFALPENGILWADMLKKALAEAAAQEGKHDQK